MFGTGRVVCGGGELGREVGVYAYSEHPTNRHILKTINSTSMT